MKIRGAVAADISVIREIASQAPESAQWSEQQIAERISPDSSNLLIVADDGGTVAGFLVAHEIAGEWELENVAVAMQARRKGIASKLIRELLKTAFQRGSRAIHLEVRASNQIARVLYEKLGFRQVGIRPRYYSCPTDDAVLYSIESAAAAFEIG